MIDAALRQALKKLGWSTKYRPHGTRTTGRTQLKEMGYRPDAIEAQLAHAEPNSVRRTYNHTIYLDERRSLMQDWAEARTMEAGTLRNLGQLRQGQPKESVAS
jgi:integrase